MGMTVFEAQRQDGHRGLPTVSHPPGKSYRIAKVMDGPWVWSKKGVSPLKIGMRDDDCIADISCEFGEFCRKNGRVIALRIGPFLPARLLFWFRSGQGRSGGRGRGGHCSRHGGLPGMLAAQSGKSCA